jgi:hypothetical protein
MRMELTTFDADSSTNGTQDAGQGLPDIHTSDQGDRVRAVAGLLQNKVLTHTFGVEGEWEVRTTLVISRQTWRYRSSVVVHGEELRKGFPPIDVDRTRQIRHAKAVAEEILLALATEAVEVHFARCAKVAEYSLMASLYAQPLPRNQRTKKGAVVLLSIAALLTAYWLWTGSHSAGPEPPHGNPPPHSVRWQPLEVSYHCPAGEPFVFPLPTLARTPEGVPVEATLEASSDKPGWLQLDPDRLLIRGTAPLAAEDQTYRLIIRAHAEQGADSRLLVLLTVTGQPDRRTPTPQLRGHWTW